MRGHQTSETMQARYGGLTDASGKFNGTVRFIEADLVKPIRTRRPEVWAVWTDLFHKSINDEQIGMAFSVMGLASDDTFLVLTKRPDRAKVWLSDVGMGKLSSFTYGVPQIPRYWESDNRMAHLDGPCAIAKRPLQNVFLGTTYGHADSLWRIDELLKCPAAVRYVSVEPLLEKIVLDADWLYMRCPGCGRHEPYCDCDLKGEWALPATLDWLIIGCESGRNRRPCKLEWVESLVDQADSARISVFIKQLDLDGRVSKDMSGWPEWARRREFPFAATTAGEEGS